MGLLKKNKFIVFLLAVFLFGCEIGSQNELILYDFESEASLDKLHWKCHTLPILSDQYAVHGEKSLKFEFYPSTYPGVSPRLNVNDWRKFSFFKFEVFNPSSESVRLVLRIDDKEDANAYNDRYNKTFIINTGANTIEVPLNRLKTSGGDRKLNLKKIYRFMFFMINPDKRFILYFDYFRLET